jgi:GNAT superfamily N-acetyltransferase
MIKEVKGMKMNIEFTTSPKSSDLGFITQKINNEIQGFGSANPFAFFIRDAEGKIIAGCNGSIIFGCIYTDQLWVDKAYRKTGLGTKLMNAIHEYGHTNGCKMATVATMSFQGAKVFYEKLGYRVDFARYGYARDSSCIFLKRDL